MKNNEERFSDEYLNAFVDDQLALEEKSRLYGEIGKDEALNRKVCELRKVRDLVQMAYKDPPSPPSHSLEPGTGSRRLRRGLVACLALTSATLTLATGLRGDGDIAALRALPPVALNGPARMMQNQTSIAMKSGTADATGQEIKVLFHLNSGDPEHMKEVLDETESLLNRYKHTHQQARVEVITNGEGLNLLLAGRSPYPGRVDAMMKKYKNLQFAACLNTLDRFNDQGIRTRLLPGAVVIDSGVAQIVRLQQEGWIYIQV